MADELLEDYSTYPRMTRWFSPPLLLKLLNNVIVSSMFGQYADRRLIIAALDTVCGDDHFARATALREAFKPDVDGAVWIDWVADLGDGFDSTYAVASLLGRAELDVDGLKLPRGQALFMGGDEVYPVASKQAYRNQLRQPYAWALPDHDKKSDDGIPLFAIPGNHDWYDGLVLFLAFFCRDKHTHFGSWRTQQRRSYFAVQLTDTWWLWATDIQLAEDMDQPQADYFREIASRMPRGSKIILCGAEPGWLYTDTNRNAWEIVDYAIHIADQANRGLTIPVLLSGDTHHYSRYSAEDGTQFITSGGGGAFLHPTHLLQDKVTVIWSSKAKELSLTTSPDAAHDETGTSACYPSKEVSRNMLWRDALFAFTNWDFSILMGVIYWLAAIGITLRHEWDAYIIVAFLFASGIVGYTYSQEKPHGDSRKAVVLISSVLHAAAHVVAVIWFTRLFADWNATHFNLSGHWYDVWMWLGLLLVEMGTVGFLIGGTLFGLNLLFTCRYLRMNHNDAFSAFRLGAYNNFLRIRIKDDELQIYAIGLEDVPQRHEWSANPKRGEPGEPVFVSSTPLSPHLIEKIAV